MSDQVDRWVQDWSETYDQTWDEEKLKAWVGKNVRASSTNGERKGFTGKIIGFSSDSVFGDDESMARRSSIITDQGLQFPIFTDMTIEEVE